MDLVFGGFPYNNTGSQDYQTTGQFYGQTWDGEMPTYIKIYW